MDASDPINLVDQLNAAAIRERIITLDRQRAALIVLLRAAQARERSARGKRLSSGESREVQHAS
jgi:hypothetical protein